MGGWGGGKGVETPTFVDGYPFELMTIEMNQEPGSAASPRRWIPRPQATDPDTLERLFGTAENILPLWIAEPSVDAPPGVVEALAERSADRHYGYEVRPDSTMAAFWSWMVGQHGWSGEGLRAVVSPSVGTSIGVLIEQFTEPGQGVIIQPPVFTDFKTLIRDAGRRVVTSPLELGAGGYHMNLADLETRAADTDTTMMILCSPHNPVVRFCSETELSEVGEICARHGVFVVADEIHADVILGEGRFHPYAGVAGGLSGHHWAATHGPIKTFGLAGVCDTVVVTDDEKVVERFERRSSQLHLTRNNVFSLAAFETAYLTGAPWFADFISMIRENLGILRDGLPEPLRLVEPGGTYLAWLDFRELGLGVRELAGWLAAEAGLALSPGHWFGRQGAGFARMTIAVPPETISEAVARLTKAVARR